MNPMRNKGFTLIELLIVVAIIAILAAIAVPNFLEAQTRSKVSRAQSDMRTLATALETYYLDNNAYPAAVVDNTIALWSGDRLGGYNAGSSAGTTFRIKNANNPAATTNQFQTLTTPVSFLTSLPSDPFANSKSLPFRYFTDGRRGWIVGSFGPDSDEGAATPGPGDLHWKQLTQAQLTNPAQGAGIKSIYLPQQGQPSNYLIAGAGTTPPSNFNITLPTGYTAVSQGNAFTYDPTNGTVSQGDVWRVKE